jgi:hypothetical protein
MHRRLRLDYMALIRIRVWLLCTFLVGNPTMYFSFSPFDEMPTGNFSIDLAVSYKINIVNVCSLTAFAHRVDMT